MEQVAYNLLCNKDVWRKRSTQRRNIWKPDIAITSIKNDLLLKKGKDLEFQSRMFDEFKAYPLDLQRVLTRLPEGFWPKWNS